MKKALRLFGLAYSLGAGIVTFLYPLGEPPVLPWVAVCLSAMLLGLVAVAWRPLMLLCAAHAGLTVTWAGTLAPGIGQQAEGALPTVVALLGLCLGMTVLLGLGLKATPLASRA